MKKQIISTAIVLTAVASAFAQNTEMRRGTVRPTGMPVRGSTTVMMAPTITTGDAATDASIKALQTEMEAKIKAIRDEYQAKIKALIGDKKVNYGNDMMNRGSSTLRMRGTSTMMRRDDDMMNGSGTPEGDRPDMMNREGDQVPAGRQVRGESTGGASDTAAAAAPTGIRGFFNRFFGR